MAEQLEVDSLEQLIKAVQDYTEKLTVNKKILVNAANICDQAMGSDDLAKKHIAQLNEALVELDKTIALSEDVAESLIRDRNAAIEVYED